MVAEKAGNGMKGLEGMTGVKIYIGCADTKAKELVQNFLAARGLFVTESGKLWVTSQDDDHDVFVRGKKDLPELQQEIVRMNPDLRVGAITV